jgi:hypothetical protein
MKIVSIFGVELLSFHYPEEEDNEYDRLIGLWTDVFYLREYAKRNNISDLNGFVNDRLNDANDIDDFLNAISNGEARFELYFEPLDNAERKRINLSQQKGKRNKNGLRIYAIKIDENCFVITGGAIKMSLKMSDHPDTKHELSKLNIARDYLLSNGVFDADSFYEWVNES